MPLSLLRPTLAGLFAVAIMSGTALAQDDTRLLDTDFGAVEIPADPVRIITTHYAATQPLLDLGLAPVGQGVHGGETNVPPALWPFIADVPLITATGDLNYELMLELEPDLIIEFNALGDQRLGQLSAIAPVMMVGSHGEFRRLWQHRVYRVADAVNRIDRYEELVGELAARQAEIAEQYGHIAAEHPIAIWGLWTEGNPSIWPSNSMIGEVLVPAGAVFAAGAEAYLVETGEETVVSDEDLGTALGDASILFYTTDLRGTPAPVVENARTQAIYQRLPAIQAGNDFPLGKLTLGGFGDAFSALDFFEAALAEIAARP